MNIKNIVMRLIDFKISILMKLKKILMSCVLLFGSLSLSGCYTQLSMFHPEIENDDSEEFYSYSSAGPMKSIGIYAQDGAGQSLGMAYQMMYNRFSGFMGFGNRYSYYNPYYYGGYYNEYYSETYTLGGYTMYIPYIDNKKPRTWSRDSKSTTTNLNVTRTRTESMNSSNNTGYTSNISSTRSSSSSSTTSSTSSSQSSNRRVTRRN